MFRNCRHLGVGDGVLVGAEAVSGGLVVRRGVVYYGADSGGRGGRGGGECGRVDVSLPFTSPLRENGRHVADGFLLEGVDWRRCIMRGIFV